MQSKEEERTRQEAKKRGERSVWEERGRIEQVCREEIRVLQVSLQDWYIDLRERERQRCAEREFHYCEHSVLNIISNDELVYGSLNV